MSKAIDDLVASHAQHRQELMEIRELLNDIRVLLRIWKTTDVKNGSPSASESSCSENQIEFSPVFTSTPKRQLKKN